MIRSAQSVRRSMPGPRPLALLLLAAATLAGCGHSTRSDGAWQDGVPRDQGFTRFLVVGVSPAYNTRCRFERMMVDSLVTAGVAAVTSCSEMRSDDPLTRDAVVAIVGKVGADAVLATRLVDAKAGVVEGGGSEDRSKAYYKATGYGYAYDPYYGGFGVPVTYGTFVAESSSFTLQRTVVISTNVYAVRDASLVYALDTTTKNQKSQGDVIDAVTAAVAEKLRRDGVLR